MAKFQTNTTSAAAPAVINITTTFKSVVILSAQTTGLCRGQIYEVNVGAAGVPNPTDCHILYDWSRSTSIGTGVVGTAVALNPADVTARAVTTLNCTAEPTITGSVSVLELTLNQRASQRWIAAPGSELVWPATNLSGIAARALSTNYAAPVMVNEFFDDL